jgi:hypothetical protein
MLRNTDLVGHVLVQHPRPLNETLRGPELRPPCLPLKLLLTDVAPQSPDVDVSVIDAVQHHLAGVGVV